MLYLLPVSTLRICGSSQLNIEVNMNIQLHQAYKLTIYAPTENISYSPTINTFYRSCVPNRIWFFDNQGCRNMRPWFKIHFSNHHNTFNFNYFCLRFLCWPTQSWQRRETMKLCQQKLSHRCCIIILLYGISVQMCGNYCVGEVIPYWPDYLLLICGASSLLTQDSRDSSDQCSSSVMCSK